MKITYKDETIIFYIKDNLIDIRDKKELEIYLKKLIVLLKKKKIDIKSGLYLARIYENKKFGLIIELENIEELELFNDMIDLKILIYDNVEIYLKMSDYFLIMDVDKLYLDEYYYVNIDTIDNHKLIYLSEFCEYVYGDELESILKHAKKVN